MNCEEAKSKFIQHINSELDPLTTKTLKAHLNSCTECSAVYSFTLLSINNIESEVKKDNDPKFYELTLAKIKNQTKVIPISHKLIQIAAAAMLVVSSIIGGTYIGNYGAEIYNDNVQIETEEAYNIIDIDLANNDIDIFREL